MLGQRQGRLELDGGADGKYIAYHADRTAAVEEQARRRLDDIAREVPITPVAAVRASRGTTRLDLVAATGVTCRVPDGQARRLAVSPWATELSVYWP